MPSRSYSPAAVAQVGAATPPAAAATTNRTTPTTRPVGAVRRHHRRDQLVRARLGLRPEVTVVRTTAEPGFTPVRSNAISCG
jgi:hypothetical protein